MFYLTVDIGAKEALQAISYRQSAIFKGLYGSEWVKSLIKKVSLL